MLNYFFGKLSVINYEMAIHEGSANQRLASQAVQILYQLSPMADNIPEKYRKKFDELIHKIEETIKNLPVQGLTPTKIDRIYNITAAKYIRLLIEIEDYFKDSL
jgi:hypothetical protein